MGFEPLTVGRDYEKFRTNSTGIRLEYDEAVWTLVVGFPDITPEEVYNFQNGAMSFAFTVIDDAIFFLAKFGAIPWTDAPFEPRLYPNEREYVSEFEQGTGAPLVVLITDSASGRLMAIRTVGLGNIISSNLANECKRLQRVQPFEAEAYSRKVLDIYERYPLSEEMLRTVKPINMFVIA